MTLRRPLFWIHLTAGSVAGLVILVMSVTGVLLACRRQVLSWADRVFNRNLLRERNGYLWMSCWQSCKRRRNEHRPASPCGPIPRLRWGSTLAVSALSS